MNKIGMSTRMRRILMIIGLVALLPAGAVISAYVASIFIHRYDDSGSGLFYGHVAARFYDREGLVFISFSGETEQQWRWAAPENYSYQSLDLQWFTEETEGEGVLDLGSFVLTTENDSFILSESVLVELISHQKILDGGPTQAEVAEVYSLLTAAALGTLPPPRHHSYSFEQPMEGNLSHFSLGWRFSYAIHYWCVAWIGIVIFGFSRTASSSKPPLEGLSDKA